MKSKQPITPFAPQEIRAFVMPLTLASILVLAGMVVEVTVIQSTNQQVLLAYGILGVIYIFVSNVLVIRFIVIRNSYGLVNSLITGCGLGFLTLILPENLLEARHILIIFCALTIATISGRHHAYIALASAIAVNLPDNPALTGTEAILEYFTPVIVSVVSMEVIIRIKNMTQQHIHRLETINKVSREIMQSLDAKQILSLLDKTIRDTLVADTYFIGFRDGDNIRLDLFHDDGEYFNGTTAPIKGTLSGWVLTHQKEMFLPDLSEDFQLNGVELLTAGKQKTSLSWIGVPLKTENITGILALASYTPNTFNRADLELLISLGQHVTLALDNAIRHEQVEKQARLDSLTGVYNHGYFLKTLAEQAEQSLKSNEPLSLIMLDIDFFKQYNDTFGHLVGDRVLNSLCTAIQRNIKHNDAVGRWGGEEFIISLPHANGSQAWQIAKRISETLGHLRVEDRNQKTVPVPTVSQGIAVFPNEADEIYQLIDIADKRLYIAKERGRNQIEPASEHKMGR